MKRWRHAAWKKMLLLEVGCCSRKGPPTLNTVTDKIVRTLVHSSLYSLTGLKHHCVLEFVKQHFVTGNVT